MPVASCTKQLFSFIALFAATAAVGMSSEAREKKKKTLPSAVNRAATARQGTAGHGAQRKAQRKAPVKVGGMHDRLHMEMLQRGRDAVTPALLIQHRQWTANSEAASNGLPRRVLLGLWGNGGLQIAHCKGNKREKKKCAVKSMDLKMDLQALEVRFYRLPRIVIENGEEGEKERIAHSICTKLSYSHVEHDGRSLAP